MKKKLTQIIMFIGLVVTVVGNIIDPFMLEGVEIIIALSGLSTVAAVLAMAFICSKNNVLQNVGFGLAAMFGASAIPVIVDGVYMVTSTGLIIMFASAFLYGFTIILEFLGFKKSGNKEVKSDVVATLCAYKSLQDEKLLTVEEFEELKNKALSESNKKIVNIDDLKKWKKLVDQNIITEEEFALMKAELITK